MTQRNNDQERKKQLPKSATQSLVVTPQQSGKQNYDLPRQSSDGEFVIIEEAKQPILSPETNDHHSPAGITTHNPRSHGNRDQGPDQVRSTKQQRVHASTSTGIERSQAQLNFGKGSISTGDFDFEVIHGPEDEKDPAKSKNNKAEKRHLDSSKVSIPRGSSSELDKDRDGFSNAVEEANTKMGRPKQSRNGGSGGILGCFFCCGPKNSATAGNNRRNPVPQPEKRVQLSPGDPDADGQRTTNGLIKAPMGTKKNMSPRNTFKPNQGDKITMFSPNSKLDDSQEERKVDHRLSVHIKNSKIKLEDDGNSNRIPRVPSTQSKSKSATIKKGLSKENNDLGEIGEIDIDAIDIDIMDERVGTNERHRLRINPNLAGVSESEVLDTIGDEVEEERKTEQEKKINDSRITRAGQKEQLTANMPLMTNPKEPKVSHSSSQVSIGMKSQLSQKFLQPAYSRQSLASDFKNDMLMPQVTEETIMIGNKMGGIHANEEIIVSPDKPKQGRQQRSAQQENETRLLKQEKQETPNLGHDYMNTPRDSARSKSDRADRSRANSVQTPHLQLPNDKSQQNYSGQRLSEFNSNKHSAASLHRSKVPASIIEEEKHDNNEVDDHLDNEKLSVPVSNFDNKMVIDQRQYPADTSAIGMNKSTAISANVSQPQKINSSAYSQADISATGISQNVGSRQGSKSPNDSRIPPVSNKTRIASHNQQEQEDNLTTVQENPTLNGTDAINYTEAAPAVAGTPYGVQIQFYTEHLHQRQKDYDELSRKLTKLKGQTQLAQRRFNKIQKDLKNVDQDNQDIQLQLNTLLKSKLMQNSIK